MNDDFPAALRTEVLTFDLHHRWFLVLFRHLETALDNHDWRFVDWACTRVADYLAVHNTCEEHSMVRFGYPSLDEHKRAHRFFVESWQGIKEAGEDRRLTHAMVDAFRTALLAHIADQDHAYGDFFQKHQLSLQANNVLWRDRLPLMP